LLLFSFIFNALQHFIVSRRFPMLMTVLSILMIILWTIELGGDTRPIHDDHVALGFRREPTLRRGSPLGIFAA
jgi:hypothetical protein